MNAPSAPAREVANPSSGDAVTADRAVEDMRGATLAMMIDLLRAEV